MEKQWEKYLFSHDAIVPVKFKRNKELEPLTVLIVTQRKHGRPVISPVGSILDNTLRQATSDTTLEKRWKKVAASVKLELAAYRQASESGDGDYIEVTGKDSIVESFAASTGIFGSLSKILHAGAMRSSSLFCNLRHNQEVSVKTECRNRLFDAKRPLWKPGMAQFDIYKQVLFKDSSTFVMWVVTEIFTASKLVIARSQDDAVEADVDVSAVVGDASGLLGKAGLQCFKRRDKFVVIEAPDGEPPFTYGFRALRLKYDEHGTLKRKDNNMGEEAPIVRGDGDDSASSLIENRTYHMGAFFQNLLGADDPASESEATDDLVCLDWDDDDEEQPDLEFTECS